MAQITQYSALYPDMMLDLPGCPSSSLLVALQRAGREFCRDSGAFWFDLDPLAVVNYQRDYDLAKGKTHAYDAQAFRLRRVAINGVVLPPASYELFESRWLRLSSDIVPEDLDEERLLICGTSPKTAYANWTGITNGSVTFVVNSSSYEAQDISFAAATSMDDVARIIETAWREAMDDPRVYCRWAFAGTNKFLLWTDSGEITYLTAGTAGTDISGALYMNGLTGSATIAPVLEVNAALLPDMRTDILPDWLLDRYGETIAAYATYLLARQRGSAQGPNPYYNPELATLRLNEYRDGLQSAIAQNAKQGRSVLDPLL